MKTDRPDLGRRFGGQPPDHQLEVAGVYRQADLPLGRQADGVAGVFLGPAVQQEVMFRIGRQGGMVFKKKRPEYPIEVVISRVLSPDRLDEQVPEARPDDFLGDDVIVSKLDVALGFLGKGTEAEFFDFLDGQAADPHEVEIENGMLGHGMVAHLENDRRVGPPGLFHFPPGGPAELISRAGVAGNPGIGRRQRFRRQVEAAGEGSEHFVQSFPVDVITGQDDFHGSARP